MNETYYASYTSSWKVNSDLNLALTLNYQDVTSPSPSTSISNSTFDEFSAGLQANFPVTKSISGAVLYQFSDNFGTSNTAGYTQNRVGMILNYHF